MPNESPEEIVKKNCLNELEQWQRWGIVVDVDDVSALGKHCVRGRWIMKTEKGKRDIIVHFKVKTTLWVYLVETKAPDGGNWNEDQQKYAKKFEGLDNCIYEVVSNKKQISATLERITNRTKLLLQEASDIMERSYPTKKTEEELW